MWPGVWSIVSWTRYNVLYDAECPDWDIEVRLGFLCRSFLDLFNFYPSEWVLNPSSGICSARANSFAWKRDHLNATYSNFCSQNTHLFEKHRKFEQIPNVPKRKDKEDAHLMEKVGLLKFSYQNNGIHLEKKMQEISQKPPEHKDLKYIKDLWYSRT